jgi:hypothetical protein
MPHPSLPDASVSPIGCVIVRPFAASSNEISQPSAHGSRSNRGGDEHVVHAAAAHNLTQVSIADLA